MIKKSFELKKEDLNNYNFLLFYGANEGFKKEIIQSFLKTSNEVFKYEEKEILENLDTFLESINTKSLFENKKIIIINRTSEKILKFILEIKSKNFKDIKIILNSENLEKKSKLRSLFEKDEKLLCIPFYPDTQQTLFKLTSAFLREKSISISSSDINLLINKSNGSRETLLSELLKIENFTKYGKKITSENISKLTNLIENHSINELVDNCLAKNKRKTVNILNENNFVKDDCILIIRTFLNKTKKILKLCKEFEHNKNIDLTISTSKPPIFWKDKEITKQQILIWKSKNLNNLIYKLSEIEVEIKKNFDSSVNIVIDFIINQTFSNINN